MIDLRGLSTAQAAHAIARLIDEAQADYLVVYELDLLDAGVDRGTVARKLAVYRGELETLRDQTLAKARALLERYGVAA